MHNRTPSYSSSSSQHSTPSTPQSLTPSPSSQSNTSDDDREFVVVAVPNKRERKERAERRAKVTNDHRIVEYDLVLANGLMKELNSLEILGRNCYFGRYGAVDKIIISSKHDSFTAKNQNVQAFVTYRNELDAAWTIAALRDLPHHDYHSVKVTYGTSRYCPKFIKGEECPHKSCFFNHQLRQNHYHKDYVAKTVPDQYKKVYDLVCDNLEYFVEKEYQQFKNRDKMEKEVICSCWRKTETISFPSNKEVLKRLISEGYIDQRSYDAAKAKIKVTHQTQRQRCTSLQNENKENKSQSKIDGILEESFSKMSETKSFLTPNCKDEQGNTVLPIKVIEPFNTTPQKKTGQQEQDMPREGKKRRVSETLEEYIEKNIINESLNLKSTSKAAANLKPLLTERVKKQNPFNGQKLGDLMSYSSCQLHGLNPEMDVSQYLVNKIMKKTLGYTKYSRFEFAHRVDVKTHISEESKIRNIIGRKLING